MKDRRVSPLIGKRVREIRKRKGMSIEDLAGLSEVSKNTIGNIELGESNLTMETFFRVALGLDLEDPAILLDEATKKVYQPARKKFKE